jgi:hypothetical protein
MPGSYFSPKGFLIFILFVAGFAAAVAMDQGSGALSKAWPTGEARLHHRAGDRAWVRLRIAARRRQNYPLQQAAQQLSPGEWGAAAGSHARPWTVPPPHFRTGDPHGQVEHATRGYSRMDDACARETAIESAGERLCGGRHAAPPSASQRTSAT